MTAGVALAVRPRAMRDAVRRAGRASRALALPAGYAMPKCAQASLASATQASRACAATSASHS